jgi:hypothetical protein
MVGLTTPFSHAPGQGKRRNGVKWFVINGKIVVTGEVKSFSRKDAKAAKIQRLKIS